MSALQILMYVAYAVFFWGTGYRAYKMANMPVHLRWDLYPVPHEKGKGHYGGSYFEETDWWTKPAEVSMSSEVKEMGREIFFIQSMFHNNRPLWFFSFPFHFGLYLSVAFVLLVFLGSLLAVFGLDVSANSGNLFARILYFVTIPFGIVGAILGAFGALGLFISRIVKTDLRRTSVRTDYFNLLLLLAIFVTGIIEWVAQAGGYVPLHVFIKDLLSFSPTAPVTASFATHMALAAAFLIYTPFTHMTHFVGKYFTYHKVRWEDERNERGGKLEGRVNEALGYKLDWAAPHIKSGGTWAKPQQQLRMGIQMSNSKETSIKDFCRKTGQLVELDPKEFPPLPPPYDKLELEPKLKTLSDEKKAQIETDLDGVSAVKFPRPETEEEKRELIEKFLSGLNKLFKKENNWGFLQPLFLTIEYCAKCQTCSSACPIYNESGEQDIYRPTYRAEILRRLYKNYVRKGGRFLAKISGDEIEATWTMVARVMELCYRCTICRRCAQTCPIGVDNGLVTRELRKIFSQEMGITVTPLHTKGSVQQLATGSSTGMTPVAFLDNIEFLEEEVEERTGQTFKWPMDKAGAEVLLIHNAGEYLAWPENPEAFAIILEAAGVDYTLSSDVIGYDSVNYGVWYDDVQFAKVALKHAEVAKKLGVKKIVLGECGHAHKALTVIADRVFTGDFNIPRESSLTLLHQIIKEKRLKLDPSRNDDIVTTLHDPCNMVRLMGIVEPQREVLKAVVNNFREMTPHGVHNYCCGGGSGFAITQDLNFPDWRHILSGRAKLRQILDVFQDVIEPEQKKYVCAPCSNCKGAIRDMFAAYGVFERCNILYGGLVELIVNAMVDIDKPFLEWEWH